MLYNALYRQAQIPSELDFRTYGPVTFDKVKSMFYSDSSQILEHCFSVSAERQGLPQNLAWAALGYFLTDERSLLAKRAKIERMLQGHGKICVINNEQAEDGSRIEEILMHRGMHPADPIFGAYQLLSPQGLQYFAAYVERTRHGNVTDFDISFLAGYPGQMYFTIGSSSLERKNSVRPMREFIGASQVTWKS